MLKEVLRMLKEDTFTSGEDIAKNLGLSRTAVWKHVRALRKKGYQIASLPSVGYRLEKAPDLLSPEQIQAGLSTKAFGRSIHYFEQIGSTQDEALRLAENGAEEGTLVVAETQTAGRGRKRRYWVSPRGTGVYLSLILRPTIEPFKMAQIPIVTGISVRDTISRMTGFQARTKWPNDVMLKEKKVAGILTEMRAEPDKVHYIIVGIGINVNPSGLLPKELRATATSVSDVVGRPVSRPGLVQNLLRDLEHAYDRFTGVGFEPFRDRWRQSDQTFNTWVTIEDNTGSHVVYALDMDKDGALVVADEQGHRRRVTAGDVTLKTRAKKGEPEKTSR